MQSKSDLTAAIAEHVRSMAPDQLRIAGRPTPSSDGSTFAVRNPATGSVICQAASASAADALAAIDAASAALPSWAALPPRTRSDVLRRVFDLMTDRVDVLAGLITWENGKPFADAVAEVRYSAEFFRWYSEEAVRTEGSYGEAPAGGSRTIVTHRPVGVAALVTPWNFPAAMAARKIAPALAAGCAVVLKPASETPLTALAIADILTEAGALPGTVNVIPSSDSAMITSTLLEDSRVRKISFTGSTEVGSVLLAQAGPRVVNASMELGGNAPFIVTEDADLDAAIAGAVVAKFRNGGQACTAANRFYVHEDVLDAFTDRLAEVVRSLVVGDPLDATTTIGPLINAKAVAAISVLIDNAVAAGARIVATAPTPSQTSGSYLAPALLRDVAPESPLVLSEIFGPVSAVVSWRDDADVLAMANASEFGLAAYVYSGDLRRALTLAEGLESGMVGVNRGIVSDPAAPFGGFKQSGLGREGAREGLREYQETQYFSVDWS